jgi:hypothetical protein
LAKAYPSLSHASESPTLHVVTDSPKLVRGLLDTAVRVHLACRVKVANGSQNVLMLLN